MIVNDKYEKQLLDHCAYNASLLAMSSTLPDYRLWSFNLLLRAVSNRRVLWLEWLECYR